MGHAHQKKLNRRLTHNGQNAPRGSLFTDQVITNANEMLGNLHELAEENRKTRAVVLVPDFEESYDLYQFRYNKKTEIWSFTSICDSAVFERLNEMGYYKRFSPDGNSLFFVLDENNLLTEVIPAKMRDAIRVYIDANTGTIKAEKYEVTYAARNLKFIRSSNSLFNEKSLQSMPTDIRPFLRDDAETCYLPYLNGIVMVTKQTIKLVPYSSHSESVIWKSQVIKRDYNPSALLDCQFAKFVSNVSNEEPDRVLALQTGMGYGIHSFNRPSEQQAVIFCDEELTDKAKPQGGTGKGVCVTAMQQMRPVAYIDGKKFDPDSQFSLQAIDWDTRIVWLDDVKHNFSFDRFFSILSVGWTIEKKNKPAQTIPRAEGPKLVICTNVAPSNEGSSNIRRQFIFEFSDFYKKRIRPGQKSQPIREVHGCEFFTDEWDKTEWERFDRYMVNCVFLYMQKGLVPYKTHNVSTNRLIQTTSDDFYQWVHSYEEKGLKPDVVYDRPALWLNYREYAGLSEKDMPSRRFTDSVKRYADSKGWIFKMGSSHKFPTFILKSSTEKGGIGEQ